MTQQDLEHSKTKRTTLKTLLGGAGVVAGSQALPEKWIKPVVSTILLPVHAGVSPDEQCLITGFEAFQSDTFVADVEVEFEAPEGSAWLVSFFSNNEVEDVSGETEGVSDGESISQNYTVGFSQNPGGGDLEVEVSLEPGEPCEAETAVVD